MGIEPLFRGAMPIIYTFRLFIFILDACVNRVNGRGAHRLC
jgi:hypothetical protein